jgi:hypothetical protein
MLSTRVSTTRYVVSALSGPLEHATVAFETHTNTPIIPIRVG